MTWSRGVAVVAMLFAAMSTLGVVKIEETTIYLLLIALSSVALPEISKLSFGKDGFTFERIEAIKQDLDTLKAGTAAAIEGQVGGALPKASMPRRLAAAARAPELDAEPLALEVDDPQAGQWGGRAEVGGRRVFARVTPSRLRSDWFEVALTVESTDPRRPLLGSVTFHLHPTFGDKRSRPVVNGRAKLDLVAWGAFTVGVEADEGETRLEIDLAQVDNAPAGFRRS